MERFLGDGEGAMPLGPDIEESALPPAGPVESQPLTPSQVLDIDRWGGPEALAELVTLKEMAGVLYNSETLRIREITGETPPASAEEDDVPFRREHQALVEDLGRVLRPQLPIPPHLEGFNS